jgi:beta-glucosidase
VFLDALTRGDFDTGLVGSGPFEHHAEWQGTLDFLGVNYYDRAWVVAKPGLLPPIEAIPCSPSIDEGLRRAFGCPEDPLDEVEGARKILVAYHERYHLPQLVTENGFIDTPDGKARSLVRTLVAIHEAIDAGANVIGYSYWTLNHDFEWNKGYAENMGLFSIAGFSEHDFVPGPTTDFTRVALHPVADVFGEIARTNAVSSDLRGRYGR